MRTVCAAGMVFGLTAAMAGAQGAAPEQGKQVYAAQKCQVCHSIAGVGNKKGPLDEVGTRLSADGIGQWIVGAPAMATKANATRKPPMKAYANLPKEELDALVAFLHSQKKKP